MRVQDQARLRRPAWSSDPYRKFAPRCSVCAEPIMPAPGQEETVRIVALDRDFHVQCYRCEVSAAPASCDGVNGGTGTKVLVWQSMPHNSNQ